MKKILAIILMLALLTSLFACGKPAEPTPSAPVITDTPAGPGSELPPTPPAAEKIGWYPDALAASAGREKYKIAYISIAMTDQLHSALNNALKEWCAKLNCDYVSFDAKADYDAFLSGVETYATQGLDAIIIDVDVSAQQRTREICDEYGVVWFPAMSPFMDEANEKYVAPAVVLNSYTCGRNQIDWMFANYQKELGAPETDASKIGYIFLDWSPHPEIHLRITGATDRYTELYPDLAATNWIPIDVLPGGPENSEGAFDLVSAYLSTNASKFDYWFIGSATDEFAIGAARAVEQLGLADKAIISAIMGGSVIEEWNAGTATPWKSLITVPLVVLAEPMLCGLLAILDGRATYESLWQDSVPAGQTYGILEFAPQEFTAANKGDYFTSVDAWIAHTYP
ncbi:MAG: substrate-binding domain-containing protein [Oscillospiraceae bacterium]|jgi:ABC-type sugar transport system substrate-binding protein|nr:substrate-binding domain-containing protein [Oscillospiraceae bacterium]